MQVIDLKSYREFLTKPPQQDLKAKANGLTLCLSVVFSEKIDHLPPCKTLHALIILCWHARCYLSRDAFTIPFLQMWQDFRMSVCQQWHKTKRKILPKRAWQFASIVKHVCCIDRISSDMIRRCHYIMWHWTEIEACVGNTTPKRSPNIQAWNNDTSLSMSGITVMDLSICVAFIVQLLTTSQRRVHRYTDDEYTKAFHCDQTCIAERGGHFLNRQKICRIILLVTWIIFWA